MNMDRIIAFNRNTLKSVPCWIAQQDWTRPPSLFNYGLPAHVFHLIDKEISVEPTEADLLCSFMAELAENSIPVRYLEIGVSVGKTFYQVAKFAQEHLQDYEIHCLDIEKINPILRKLLDDVASSEAKRSSTACRPRTGLRQEKENVILRWNGGKFTYYEADEFDNDIWD